jgi:hypothetical protein
MSGNLTKSRKHEVVVSFQIGKEAVRGPTRRD